MTDDPVALELFERWQFKPNEVISEGYCSIVYLDESKALKVPFQGEEQTSGLRAFLAYPESIRPKVFKFDKTTGAILMERMVPGTNLGNQAVPLSVSTQVFATAAKKIASIAFEDPIPLATYIEREGELADRLLQTTTDPVYLHGDLHHWNILMHRGDWKVIDAKGVYGDPAYEAAAFVMNPLDQLKEHTQEYTKHRIELIAEATGLDPKRIIGWSLLRFDQADLGTDAPCAFQHEQLKHIAIEFGWEANLLNLA